MEVEFVEAAEDVMLAVDLRDEDRHSAFVPTSGSEPIPGPFAPGERIIVRLRFENWLAPGRYTLTPTLATVDPEHRVLDHRPDVGALLVESPLRTGGAVDIPTELDIERL